MFIMTDQTLIIDIVLWTVYLLLAAAVGGTLWSAIHGVRTHEQATDLMASRHASVTGYATVFLVVTVMVITYLLASAAPVVSNGQPFTDTFWLRLTDMFIFTSLLLICVCSAIVVIAKCRR